MDDQKAIERLREFETRIVGAPRRPVLDGENWHDGVPNLGGVYVIWDKLTGCPVYVGETCHLNHRLSDLGQRTKHTFLRKIAGVLDMLDADDSSLLKAITERYELSFLHIPLGRKEVEEFLILRWKDKNTLINKPPGRLVLSENYPDIR